MRLNLIRNTARIPAGRRLRTALGAIALIVVTATGAGAISASAGVEAGANQLDGSWMASVNRGPTLPALKSVQTYNDGGEYSEMSNGGPLTRTPAHGVWEHVSGRTYTVTGVFFRYDPANNGAPLGTVKLRQTLELSRDGKSFTGYSVPEFRDPDGNLLPGSNTRKDVVTGVRMEVESPPDL